MSQQQNDFEEFMRRQSNRDLFKCVMKDCADELQRCEKLVLKHENSFRDASESLTHYVDSSAFKDDALNVCCTLLRCIDKLFAL